MVSEHASPLAVLGGVDAGGQNVHVAALARQLGREADVKVFTRRDDAALPPRVAFGSGVEVVHLDAGPPIPVAKDDLPPFMDEFACRLSDELSRWRPDVVHAHFWMSGRASVQAARPLGIPVVQTFHALGVVKHRHQGGRDTSPTCRVAVEQDLARAVDHIVATCADELSELTALGADPAHVSVVPCGVDLDLFRPDGPGQERRPGRRRLLVVSRLVERKGVGNVVAALACLPDTELVVAGGPPVEDLGADPEARRLRRLAAEHGVADRVDLRGRVERADLPALYRSADAVVCVPWYEPFGIVPLEAMACGVPVIASAVGGLTDTVVHGETGLLVTPRRVAQVAAAAEALLGDAATRARLGRAGVHRARTRYGWPRVAAATMAAYAAVLDRRPVPLATAASARTGPLMAEERQ